MIDETHVRFFFQEWSILVYFDRFLLSFKIPENALEFAP